MGIIETSGLSRRFKEVIAVDDLTMTVESGEVLALLGPNGAGKTTTIRMLAGIIRPTGGEAIVAGHRIDRNVEKLHEVIGMLTETPGLYSRLSARRNLEYFAGFYPIDDVSSRVEKYLKLMGLWERREDKAGTFSKGMKQRLALARALMHEPKVLFLDEPTSGLDPEAAGEVRQLIRRMREEGCTIFLSTHNLGEAEMLCNRIAVIQTRLLALDTAESLRRRFFRRKVIVELESPDPNIAAVVRELPFVQEAKEEGSRLSIELIDSERNRPELVRAIVEARGKVITVSEEQYTLEQVYLRLMNEEKVNDTQAH
ncbi:MAG TPA: ABC transporter ATP-binding protein [Dehalococcoidales bacterium]|nr:ABC transporter ATP-binding protein [Dehalococcoidales bacterium]